MNMRSLKSRISNLKSRIVFLLPFALLACQGIAAERLQVGQAEAVYRVRIVAPESVRSWEVMPAELAEVTTSGDRVGLLLAPAGVYRVSAETVDGSGWFATVTLGQPAPGPGPGPAPTPTPVEPPTPNPKPVDPPAPVVAKDLHALIVEETAVRGSLPAGQREILLSNAPGGVRQWFVSHAVKAADGKTPEIRVLDQDAVMSHDAEVWQKAFARPRASVPWWYVWGGGQSIEGPLPPTAAEALKQLRETFGQ